jgi:hypothetical protein
MQFFRGNNALARNNVKLGSLGLVIDQSQYSAEVSLAFLSGKRLHFMSQPKRLLRPH